MHSRKRGVVTRLPFFFSHPAVFFLLLTALCFVAYANTFPNPFIFDDIGLIVANPAVKSSPLTGDFLRKNLFAASFLGSNFYRPMQELSFIVDYSIWAFNPVGYHLTNICLQALVSCLVYLFLLGLTRDRFIAGAAALFFCVSPIHTEAVAYVSGRADSLMAVFILSSFLLFVRAQPECRGRWWYLAGALFMFICSLLSKELAIVFPFVLCAWGYYTGRFKEKWFFTPNILSFLVIAGVYALLRSSILKFAPLLAPDLNQYPLWLRFAILPQALGTYARILVFPVGLHMSWTLIRPMTSFEVVFALAGAFSAVYLSAYLLFFRRMQVVASFLFAWAVIFFLPQSGLYPINAFVAEHFIYLPSISAFAGIAWLLRSYVRRPVAYAAVAGFVVFFCILTASRNYEWRDPVVFYSKILELSPYSYTARVNLGVEYINRKKYDLAEEQLKLAIGIKPKRIEAYSNLASAYYQAGKYTEALEQFRVVEGMVPYFKAGEVQNNVGLVLLELKRYDEALARLHLAGRLDPSLSFPHYNSAHVLMRQGREDEAVEESIRSFPPNLVRHDGEPGFIDAFRTSLRVEDLKAPATFYNNLGVRLLVAQFDDWGYAALTKAYEIMPDYADVMCNIGFFFYRKDQISQARSWFKKVLAADPRHLKAAALLKATQEK